MTLALPIGDRSVFFFLHYAKSRREISASYGPASIRVERKPKGRLERDFIRFGIQTEIRPVLISAWLILRLSQTYAGNGKQDIQTECMFYLYRRKKWNKNANISNRVHSKTSNARLLVLNMLNIFIFKRQSNLCLSDSPFTFFFLARYMLFFLLSSISSIKKERSVSPTLGRIPLESFASVAFYADEKCLIKLFFFVEGKL